MDAWRRNVDRIILGEANVGEIRLSGTPQVLIQMGWQQHSLVMRAGKIARVRREHPQVPLQVWYDLPQLLANPNAIFPSQHDDGSMIVAISAVDTDGHPILVPLIAEKGRSRNVVLTMFGKQGNDLRTGLQWIDSQIAFARKENQSVYVRKGFAGAEPKPETAIAVSSSPGPIPADGPAKPERQILSLRSNVKFDS